MNPPATAEDVIRAWLRMTNSIRRRRRRNRPSPENGATVTGAGMTYRRVSSERNRADQGVVSSQEQREALQKLAEDEEYETVGEYCDGDETEMALTE